MCPTAVKEGTEHQEKVLIKLELDQVKRVNITTQENRAVVSSAHQRSFHLFLCLLQKVAPPGMQLRGGIRKRLTGASVKKER